MKLGDAVLMEDGLIHVVSNAISERFYDVWCEAVLSYDLDQNGGIVLDPPTCLACAARGSRGFR